MIIVPDRLEDLPSVSVYYKSPSFWFLRKESRETMRDRQSYISMPVFSMVSAGEQHIYTDEGQKMVVKAGQVVFLKKGLYTINDLITDGSTFQTDLYFFNPRHILPNVGREERVTNAPQTTFLAKAPKLLFSFGAYLSQLQEDPVISKADLFTQKASEYLSLLFQYYPILKQYLSDDKPGPAKNIRSFMEVHFDKPLTVADYAYLTGRTPSTFRREFKTKYGVSPRQWIIQQRLSKSLQLLQNTEWEVTQIALEVGYQNTSHFINAFKKLYGYTPGQHSRMA